MKSTKKLIAALLTAVLMIAALPLAVSGYTYGFADMGDSQLEYAVYGEENEQTIILIPGNSADLNGLAGFVQPALDEGYRVVTFSPRGTGKTEIGDNHLTFELEADDLNRLMEQLGIENAYIYGFSDGANLGIVFTLMYPERVTKLVIQSPNINPAGTKLFSQLRILWQYFILKIECMFKSDPDFVRQREVKGMMVDQPKLTAADLKNINIPVFHIYGEFDMMYRMHSEMISASIPGCRSMMVKGASHSSAFDEADTLLNPYIFEFFNS